MNMQKTRFDAVQNGGMVTVTATGVNPTTGWKNTLTPSPIPGDPPTFTLKQTAPKGMVLQVLTPFTAEAQFPYSAVMKPQIVQVIDGNEKHVVPIRSVTSVEQQPIVALDGLMATIPYERILGVYDDLASQHCTTECEEIKEILPGIKVCTKYRTVCQHIRVHAVLHVEVGSPQDVGAAVEAALKKAAVAAGIAAFLAAFASGGAAAVAAKDAFVAVLTVELTQTLTNLLQVKVEFKSEWV